MVNGINSCLVMRTGLNFRSFIVFVVRIALTYRETIFFLIVISLYAFSYSSASDEGVEFQCVDIYLLSFRTVGTTVSITRFPQQGRGHTVLH